MFRLLVIAAIIAFVAWFLYRRFGGPRVQPDSPKGKPPLITSDAGSVGAEVYGQELDLDPDLVAEIRALITDGNKIEAIKRLREATGLGLTEAKQIVDSLERLRR